MTRLNRKEKKSFLGILKGVTDELNIVTIVRVTVNIYLAVAVSQGLALYAFNIFTNRSFFVFGRIIHKTVSNRGTLWYANFLTKAIFSTYIIPQTKQVVHIVWGVCMKDIKPYIEIILRIVIFLVFVFWRRMGLEEGHIKGQFKKSGLTMRKC